MGRSQAGLESVFILAVLSLVVIYISTQVTQRVEVVGEETARKGLEKLADVIEEVQIQGASSSQTVEIFIPDNVNPQGTYMGDGVINLAVESDGKTKDIAVPVDGCIAGALPTDPGYHLVTVKGGDCANMDSGAVEVFPPTIYEWVKVGSQLPLVVSINSTKAVNVSVQSTGDTENFIDLSGDPGMQLTNKVEAPSTLPVTIIVPAGTEPKLYKGDLVFDSEFGRVILPINIVAYSSSVQLMTYIDPERSVESAAFTVADPIYFTAFAKRNGMLYQTNINYSLDGLAGGEVDSGTGEALGGMYNGETSASSIGTYNLTVVDINTDATAYQAIDLVKRMGWYIVYDSPVFQVLSESKEVKIPFEVLDQRGMPVKLPVLAPEGYEFLIKTNSSGWKYYQKRSCGDTCDPLKVTCTLPGNWTRLSFIDSSWTNVSTPDQAWKYWSGSSWKNCDLECTRLYRKKFTLSSYDVATAESLRINCQSDEGCVCYINGQLVGSDPACRPHYTVPPTTWVVTNTSMLLVGDNVFACHVTQYNGGDLELFDGSLEIQRQPSEGVRVEWMKKVGPPNSQVYTKDGLNYVELKLVPEGDHYYVTFNSTLLNKTYGESIYEIKMNAFYGSAGSNLIRVDDVITFNFGQSAQSNMTWQAKLLNPTEPNYPVNQALNIQVAILDQKGNRASGKTVVVTVKDTTDGSVVKMCNTASETAGVYSCLVEAGKLTAGRSYLVEVRDKTLSALDHYFSFTINGVVK